MARGHNWELHPPGPGYAHMYVGHIPKEVVRADYAPEAAAPKPA